MRSVAYLEGTEATNNKEDGLLRFARRAGPRKGSVDFSHFIVTPPRPA